MALLRLTLDAAQGVSVSPSDLFDGAVSRQSLVAGEGAGAPWSSDSVRVNLVTFGPGGHTELHTHELDQVLIVTEGRGVIGTPTEVIHVGAGDVVVVPAGEQHFHGAVAESMSHVAVMAPCATTVVRRLEEWPPPGA
jgi:quercetin dioxygenase-like cupin family protein